MAAPLTPLGARTPHRHPALPRIIGLLSVVVVVAAYVLVAHPQQWWPFGETSSGLSYRNIQYGFSFSLPADWSGYTVLTTQWEGRDIASGQVTEHGPRIALRHPQWKSSAPWEDLPVLVFTDTQWQKIQKEQISLGAAPIGPSVLGRNHGYILALPARYNFDYSTGWEVVENIVKTFQAFVPIGK